MQEAARREKRRLLDAQRGKCRVRLGSHLDEWCALKDHLGFSLHSQLAKFLLDSYRTTANPGTSVPKAITHLSVSLTSLHRLALLCHQHGRNCQSPPNTMSPPHSDEAAETPVLLWGCTEEHQFQWDPRDYTTEMETKLAGVNGEGKVSESPSTPPDKTQEQEENPESSTKEGQLRNTETQPDRHNVSPQRAEIEPDNSVTQEMLSESDITLNRCPEIVNAHTGPSDDVERLCEGLNINKELTEERQQETSADEHLNTSVYDKRQGHITGVAEELYQSAGCEEIPNLAAEERDPIDEGTGPPSGALAEGTQESISINPARRKPQVPQSGRASKRQRRSIQFPESNLQTIKGEPKAALSVPCRRSPRGSKGCRMKADEKEQAPHSKAHFTRVRKVAAEARGWYIDTPLGTHGNIETSTEIYDIQESIAEEVIEPKTSPEDLEWSKPHIDQELAQIRKKRIRKASPTELLMCEFDDCGKIFSKRQYLNYHQKYQHMNQRTFRCSVLECGKTFNFKKHLKEHEKRHSDRRDYICEFCARAFRSSSNLIIHRRIHTGEKPLQCEFCGFTCRQKASLNWHMKKHDAESFYQFPCDICGQRFEKRDNLAAHRSRKHPAPRETVPPHPAQCIASSIDNAGETDASYKADCPEGLSRNPAQEMAQTSQESVKETFFPEYLDLTEGVQGAPHQIVQSSESTEISLVIVL